MFHYVLFADDTNLVASHSDFNTLVNYTNEELVKVENWFYANELIVNYDKTYVMYFSKKCKRKDISDVKINMHGTSLNFCRSVKFLGVTLDDDLSFNDHRLLISNKLSKTVGILCKLRSFLPEKILFMLYNSLALPYLQYCNIISANAGVSKLDQLHKLQKKLLRICTNSSFRAHSRPLFFRLKTLNIYDIHNLQKAILMYRVFNDNIPMNISYMFTLNRSVHHHNTRSSNKFHFPKVKSQSLLDTVRHSGPRLWNNLSNEIRNSTNITAFKSKLKKNYIESYSDVKK